VLHDVHVALLCENPAPEFTPELTRTGLSSPDAALKHTPKSPVTNDESNCDGVVPPSQEAIQAAKSQFLWLVN